MDKNQFTENIISLISRYIEDFSSFDSNPQLCVNPVSFDATVVNGADMLKGIEYSNEAVEDAAGAEGARSEDGTDFQVRRNPDFYAIKDYLKKGADSKVAPDDDAVRTLVGIYFPD